jgi:hypothetical protein
VTELDSLMTQGLTEAMTGAGSVTAAIGGTTVTGMYAPGEQTSQLGVGGLVNPAPADFTYLASAASAPAALSVVTVAHVRRRVASTQADGGLITVTLEDLEDVR